MIDFFYAATTVYLKTGRKIRPVVDRLAFNLRGLFKNLPVERILKTLMNLVKFI